MDGQLRQGTPGQLPATPDYQLLDVNDKHALVGMGYFDQSGIDGLRSLGPVSKMFTIVCTGYSAALPQLVFF